MTTATPATCESGGGGELLGFPPSIEQQILASQVEMVSLLKRLAEPISASPAKPPACGAGGEPPATSPEKAAEKVNPEAVKRPFKGDEFGRHAAAKLAPLPTQSPTGPGPALGFGGAMDVLRGERDYQKRRWGRRHQQGGRDVFVERRQSVGDFIVFMDHYLALAKCALATQSGEAQALSMLRKVTALGVSAIETHGSPVRNPDAPVVNGHDGLAA